MHSSAIPSDIPDADLSLDERDSAEGLPKCVVVDAAFSWGQDAPLRIPWHKTLIYEMHVKGFTARHPKVPKELRGTYAGLTHPAVVDYLKSLGITAVELMPVHQFVADKSLVDRGLTNYWGYNSIGFFAPESRYASTGVLGEQVAEFKTMVKTFHREGIEVIIDVVYNHTGEGNHLGPTLCFRGIDNASYYRLVDDRRYYMDYTGCGNTLNMTHPHTLQLIMDSLRYWVLEMHVDGFRFDLASTLARELHSVDRLGAFFDIIHQDPVLSQVKLIAEPWDLGEGGYQVGNFPVLWAEWNAEYRDTVRRFWKGEGGLVGGLAMRLTGSSDLYGRGGRRPYASINFVTAHDGFTLADLVSYNEKHNEANGEENRDGHNENLSWNCGAEGPTDDREIIALRARQQRNFLATLILSQGVPMLLAGDEIGRTQRGNNNAYCQDNEISWMDWKLDRWKRELLEFTQLLIRLFHQHPVLRRRVFFQGRRIRGSEVKDLAWFKPDGKEMTDDDWNNGFARCLGLRLAGDAIEEVLGAEGGGLRPDVLAEGPGERLPRRAARDAVEGRRQVREPEGFEERGRASSALPRRRRTRDAEQLDADLAELPIAAGLGLLVAELRPGVPEPNGPGHLLRGHAPPARGRRPPCSPGAASASGPCGRGTCTSPCERCRSSRPPTGRRARSIRRRACGSRRSRRTRRRAGPRARRPRTSRCRAGGGRACPWAPGA